MVMVADLVVQVLTHILLGQQQHLQVVLVIIVEVVELVINLVAHELEVLEVVELVMVDKE